jgi:hypothetical protein
MNTLRKNLLLNTIKYNKKVQKGSQKSFVKLY